MLVKVATLIGEPLDWAVSTFLGSMPPGWLTVDNFRHARGYGELSFSTNWSQGGPLSESHFIESDITACGVHSEGPFELWTAYKHSEGEDIIQASGPTELVAKMRCLVMFRKGAEVDIPDELLENQHANS